MSVDFMLLWPTMGELLGRAWGGQGQCKVDGNSLRWVASAWGEQGQSRGWMGPAWGGGCQAGANRVKAG